MIERMIPGAYPLVHRYLEAISLCRGSGRLVSRRRCRFACICMWILHNSLEFSSGSDLLGRFGTLVCPFNPSKREFACCACRSILLIALEKEEKN